jgi:hypothetical protein
MVILQHVILMVNHTLLFVDDSKCDPDAKTFSPWVQSVSGPKGYGDGEYVMEGTMLWQGQMLINSEMKATMKNNEKILEEISFYAGGAMKGVMRQTFDPATNDATLYFTTNENNEKSEWVYAEYNKNTKIGKAVSGKKNEWKYELNIGATAIYKRRIAHGTNSGATTQSCIDFQESAMKAVNAGYKLFSEIDGSKLTYVSGFPIKKDDVTAYPDGLEGWIDYWGFHAFPYTEDGNTLSSDQVKTNFANGASGIKKLIEDSTTSGVTYTMKKSPASLRKVSKFEAKLGDVINMPMIIDDWSSKDKGSKLQWTGTEFQKIGELGVQCFSVENNEMVYKNPTSDWSPTSTSQCGCMNSDGSYDGSKNPYAYPPPFYGENYEKIVSGSSTFDVSSFERGIEIKVGNNIRGKVQLKFNKHNIINGPYYGNYLDGQTVTQESSGAEGTLVGNSADRKILAGLIPVEGSKPTITYEKYNKCDKTGGDIYTGNTLYEGLKLTQLNSGATGIVATTAISDYEIKEITGTWTSNAADTVTVSLPSNNYPLLKSLSLISATGTLKFSANTKKLRDTEIPTYGAKNCVCTKTVGECNSWLQLDVTDGASTTTNGINAGIRADGRITAFPDPSKLADNACNNPRVKSTTITAKLNAEQIQCDVIPTFDLQCDVGVLAASSGTIEVKLKDGSKDFEAVDYGDANSGTSKAIKINNVELGQPYWAYSRQGTLKTVTNDNIIEYSTNVIVNADATVPNLSCIGSNCPLINAVDTLGKCTSSSECSKPDTSAVFSINILSNGVCTTKPTGITLSSELQGITFDDLQLDYQSLKDGSGNDVEELMYAGFKDDVTKRGTGCTSSSTITFTGGTCTTYPTVSLQCANSDQVSADLQYSNKYTFDSMNGVLTDVATGVTQDNTENSNFLYFGPFFEETTTNKEDIVCDFNDDFICTWEVRDKLNEYYEYFVGPNDGRASLIDSNSKPIAFDSPKYLLYTHSGTTSNSGRNYNGAKFLLEYRGEGELEGIPQMCLNKVTGATMDCVPGSSIAIPDFNLPKDAVFQNIITNNKFVARPSSILEYYPTQAESVCTTAGLNFDNMPTAEPLSTYYKDPSTKDDEIPSANEYKSDYAYGGVPLAVGGVPMFEMPGSNGECKA